MSTTGGGRDIVQGRLWYRLDSCGLAPVSLDASSVASESVFWRSLQLSTSISLPLLSPAPRPSHLRPAAIHQRPSSGSQHEPSSYPSCFKDLPSYLHPHYRPRILDWPLVLSYLSQDHSLNKQQEPSELPQLLQGSSCSVDAFGSRSRVCTVRLSSTFPTMTIHRYQFLTSTCRMRRLRSTRIPGPPLLGHGPSSRSSQNQASHAAVEATSSARPIDRLRLQSQAGRRLLGMEPLFPEKAAL